VVLVSEKTPGTARRWHGRPATFRPWVAALLLASCGGGGGGGGDNSATIWIAVEADVTLQIGIVGVPPASLKDVAVDSSTFTVGTPQLLFQQVEVPVRASQVGDATLTIDFVDDHGAAHTKKVLLHAAAITVTTVDVQCRNSGEARAAYTFSPGAAFTFIAQAFAGDKPLLSGTLELVQQNGFTLAPPTGQDREQRSATAPLQTGAYAWQLAGSGSATFVVYDAAALVLSLTGSIDPTSRITSLTVGLGAGGEPVCVHDHDDRITITVTAGACRPAMSGAEVNGPMPVNARDGTPSVQLFGSGACTVEARIDGGGATTETFDVEPEMLPPPETAGMPLSPAGVQIGSDLAVGSACAASPTDGNCDGKPDTAPVSDPDCFANSDWSVQLFDGTADMTTLAPGDLVGVGLTTELLLEIVAYGVRTVGPPQNLRIVNTPASSLQITDHACDGVGYQHMTLVPQAPGQASLELRADNLADVGAFAMEARAIARTAFDTSDRESGVPTPDPVVDYFPRSWASLGVHYEAADGSRLRGYAPVMVSSDVAGAGALLDTTPILSLYTGNAPHTITVASPRIGSMQTIRVRDASTIAGIGGGFTDAAVVRGETVCVDMYPTEAGGRRIFGVAPSRPVLTLTGSALVMGPNAGCPTGVALEGFATGTTGVAFAWGAGSAAHTWTVTGP
jgi:hypothetical protein